MFVPAIDPPLVDERRIDLVAPTERRRSEEDVGELAATNDLAETEWRLAQRVEEQVAAREAATAGELAAKDAEAAERLAEMERRLAQR